MHPMCSLIISACAFDSFSWRKLNSFRRIILFTASSSCLCDMAMNEEPTESINCRRFSFFLSILCKKKRLFMTNNSSTSQRHGILLQTLLKLPLAVKMLLHNEAIIHFNSITERLNNGLWGIIIKKVIWI